jgi:hypothetical protein
VPAIGAQRLHLLLQRAETPRDPVRVPGVDLRLVVPERRAQVVQHPQVVQRVDVAGDGERESAHLRALRGRARQQRRRRVRFLEVLDDGERLADDLVAVDEHRDQPLGVQREELRRALRARGGAQVDRDALMRESLVVKRDARPVGGGAAKKRVELHRSSPVPAERSCA